jgi:hypothetical protein
MTAKAKSGSIRLTSDQLGHVMELIKGVDSVELKLTIPADAHRATIRGLPIDPVEAEPRQVFFFDTPKLDLNRAGLVVRARRIRGGGADTVVKLRPVEPKEISDNARRSDDFKVELDALPGGYVCSASCRGRSTGDEVREVVLGQLKLSRILSKDQRAFFKKHAPTRLNLDALVPLGPTFVLRSRFYAKPLDRKIGAELWLYPDGTRILELSTKAAPAEAFQVGAEFRAYLVERGIEADGKQQTKTSTALTFFCAHLNGAGRRNRK